ncbi:UDP-glucose 4-epimerase GalE [Hydrogenophaga atypica]|uniref:UDP-glucose 4-epimerase n=1 Tax=Hydrogenophaga atypica TaxID=249409 RepID=A0ABW2QG57_9BURK
MTSPYILVTGGAGYIGSHTTLALLQAGFSVVVLDNLCNSSAESLTRVAALAGRQPQWVPGDVRDAATLDALFQRYPVQAVLHFAGLKAVGDSVRDPLQYFDNNVVGSLTLCQAMQRANVHTLVFSSSATVYGADAPSPYSETTPVGTPVNPYGRSKLMVEDMLRDLAASDARWRVALLRYFNPVGAHESGQIGEDPLGVPNNLVPYIAQVAVGRLGCLSVYGDDYPTADGTGVRDYIHVVDLAEGHVAALRALTKRAGVAVWNLGTGKGSSVLEVIRSFEAASGQAVPYRVVPRRAGDLAAYWADASVAQHELGWSAQRDLDQMMRDTWRWQQTNPQGYRLPVPAVEPMLR